MSLVHYLSIGHYRIDSQQAPSSLGQRVMAHFVPGGLARLDAPSTARPLTKKEVERIERVLLKRHRLEVDLNAFLLESGVLSVPYTTEAGPYRVAWPIALVAREELGATVSERGSEFADEHIRRCAEAAFEANTRTRSLLFREPLDRLLEVIAEIRTEKRNPYQSLVLFDDIDGDDRIVDALTPLLEDKDDGLRAFAGYLIPKLGPVAEPALRRMLRMPRQVDSALLTLGTFDVLADETRAEVIRVCEGNAKLEPFKEHVLGESFIKKKLAKLRAAHGRVSVPDDIDAWAHELPQRRVARVVASALDSQSVGQFPESGKLSRAVAKAIRASEITSHDEASVARLHDLQKKHNWMHIRGYDGPLFSLALSALEDRDALVQLVERLEHLELFFLLLHS